MSVSQKCKVWPAALLTLKNKAHTLLSTTALLDVCSHHQHLTGAAVAAALRRPRTEQLEENEATFAAILPHTFPTSQFLSFMSPKILSFLVWNKLCTQVYCSFSYRLQSNQVKRIAPGFILFDSSSVQNYISINFISQKKKLYCGKKISIQLKPTFLLVQCLYGKIIKQSTKKGIICSWACRYQFYLMRIFPCSSCFIPYYMLQKAVIIFIAKYLFIRYQVAFNIYYLSHAWNLNITKNDLPVDTPEICTFSECSARAPFPKIKHNE